MILKSDLSHRRHQRRQSGYIVCNQEETRKNRVNNVVSVAAGEDFCLAITTNHAVADKFR